MQNRQSQVNRCRCWGKTTVVFTIEHCPTLVAVIEAECDKIVKFTLDQTLLPKFGKPHFSLAEFTTGEQHDVPSMPQKADA